MLVSILVKIVLDLMRLKGYISNVSGRENKSRRKEMNKNAMISKAILDKMSQGMTTREAVDQILGVGTFDRIAGDIWEALRK